MKIILPSNGVLGLKSVEMRPPTYSDIRNVQNLNSEEELLKVQFVQQLLNNVDYNKMSKMDIDYLFTIAAMQVQLNSIGFSCTCPCGHIYKDTLTYGEQEVNDLPKIKLPHVVKVKNTEFKYTILTAQNHIDACEYALQQDDFQTAYEDAAACFIFGKDLMSIEWVKQLDISTYLSAFLFQQATFHGVRLEKQVTCPKCGKVSTVKIIPTTELIKVDTNVLMNQFVNVSSVLDFDNFLRMTIPEFNTFKETLNASI